MKKLKCKYCEKEFKTEKGLAKHYDIYCEEAKLERESITLDKVVEEVEIGLIETLDEVVELVEEEIVELVEEEIVEELSLFERVKEFLDSTSIIEVHKKGESFDLFKKLYKEYYNKDMERECKSGIAKEFTNFTFARIKMEKLIKKNGKL